MEIHFRHPSCISLNTHPSKPHIILIIHHHITRNSTDLIFAPLNFLTFSFLLMSMDFFKFSSTHIFSYSSIHFWFHFLSLSTSPSLPPPSTPSLPNPSPFFLKHRHNQLIMCLLDPFQSENCKYNHISVWSFLQLGRGFILYYQCTLYFITCNFLPI